MINVDNPVQTWYFYHYDGLGSVVALSNTSGTIVERYEYTAFGETTIYNAAKTQTFSQSQYDNPYMFTGRRYDPETGLYYYRARYYAPKLGRFLQPDPIGYGDGMNMYAYCGNNPLNWIDPWGLEKESWYNKAWDSWETKMRSLDNKYGPEPGFGSRFKSNFDRNRWAGAEYLSAAPLYGPISAAGTYYGAKGLEHLATREASRNFTSFSATRSSAYMSGFKPGYFKAAKFLRGASIVSTGVTVFYTGTDIGTAIYSIGASWRE